MVFFLPSVPKEEKVFLCDGEKFNSLFRQKGPSERHTNWKMDWQDVGISCLMKVYGEESQMKLHCLSFFVFHDPLQLQLCFIMPVYHSPGNSSAFSHRRIILIF
jgi:hypothetical protein